MAPHLSLKYFDNTEEFEVDCCRASLDSNPNHPFITMFGSLAVSHAMLRETEKSPGEQHHVIGNLLGYPLLGRLATVVNVYDL